MVWQNLLAEASFTGDSSCVQNQVGWYCHFTSSIPKEYEDRYRAFYARSMEQMALKKCLHTQIDGAMAIKQTLAVANLLGKHGIAMSGGTSSSPSMSIHSSPLVQSSLATKVGVGASHSSISTSMRDSMTSTPLALSSQSSISASIQNMDIRKSHNAIVEMAIADFFHCENNPDAVVELPRFWSTIPSCSALMCSTLIGHPMYRRLGKYWWQSFLVLFASMVVNMWCHSSSHQSPK